MTIAEINRQKVQRILDSPQLIAQLRANVEGNETRLSYVLAEVMDDKQRQQLREALSD